MGACRQKKKLFLQGVDRAWDHQDVFAQHRQGGVLIARSVGREKGNVESES